MTQPDVGEADPVLAEALAGWDADPSPGASALVHAALLGARLLVPVVAALSAEPSAGLTGEAEMALPTILGRDGRVALPVFTSVSSLTRWRAEARPVPVPGADALKAAGAEGCSALLVDVAGPVSFVLEDQELTDLAAGYLPVVGTGDAALAARTVAGGLPVVAPAVPPPAEALAGICSALAGEPLIAEAFLLAPADGPQQPGLTLALVLFDEIESSDVLAMVRRVATSLGGSPLVPGGLDLAVLTPEQRRQAHRLGPPAYSAAAGVVRGPG